LNLDLKNDELCIANSGTVRNKSVIVRDKVLNSGLTIYLPETSEGADAPSEETKERCRMRNQGPA
jgi:hypothetical protein